MPTTPGSISPSPATTTSAKLWRSWRRQKTATWSNSEQRRRTAVHRARGNSNARTTSWTDKKGQSRQSWCPCLVWTGRRSMRTVCTPSSLRNTEMANSSWVHLHSCLEQNIKNTNQFRHVNQAFLCREGMLLGAFTRNQFSYSEGNVLTAEKIPSPEQSISAKEVSRRHSQKQESCSHTRWGCRIEWDQPSSESLSSSAFTEKNWKMFVQAHPRRQVRGLTFVMVRHVLTFPSDWAMYLLTIHLSLSQQFHPIHSTYYITDLNDHLLVEGAP